MHYLKLPISNENLTFAEGRRPQRKLKRKEVKSEIQGRKRIEKEEWIRQRFTAIHLRLDGWVRGDGRVKEKRERRRKKEIGEFQAQIAFCLNLASNSIYRIMPLSSSVDMWKSPVVHFLMLFCNSFFFAHYFNKPQTNWSQSFAT